MEKHANIPDDATWDEQHSHWELGKKNDAGTPIGEWTYWDEEGTPYSSVDFGDGRPPFLYRFQYSDGTRAEGRSTGELLDEKKPWNGLKYTGEYTLWDHEGKVKQKHQYDENGLSAHSEIFSYEGDKLSVLETGDNNGSDTSITRYRHDADGLVPREITVRKQKMKNGLFAEDTITLYDKAGTITKTVRDERLSDRHERHYFNNLLVYEGIKSADESTMPSKFTYYHPNGKPMLEFKGMKKKQQLWHRYDEQGNLVSELLCRIKDKWGEDVVYGRYFLFYKPEETDPWQAVASSYDEEYKSIQEKKEKK